MNELLRTILFLPPQASTVARDIDYLHYFVISVTMVGSAFVAILAGYFIVKYRMTTAPSRPQPREGGKGTTWGGTPVWLEIAIIGGLLSLFLLFWVIGFRQYVGLRTAPDDAEEVYVTAKKWMWSFAYPDGSQSNGVLYVPEGRPVRLLLSSRDVIHSFYVPAFRVKQDVVPGRMTSVWFESTEEGRYKILCAEYCGAGHSTMRAAVVVLSGAEWARRFDRDPRDPIRGPVVRRPPLIFDYPEEELSLVRAGKQVAAEEGCLRCHTLDGTEHIGPSWQGMYLSTVRTDDGDKLTADEAYLTESMMDPLAVIHEGYDPVMPSYQGRLSPPEVGALLELIKSLEDPRPKGERDPLPLGPVSVPVPDGRQR